jgi:hypothetical protein
MGARTWIAVASLATIVVAAAAVALWAQGDPRPGEAGSSGSLAALREEIRSEREARRALASELERLRAEVERLAAASAPSGTAAGDVGPETPQVAAVAGDAAEAGGDETGKTGEAEPGAGLRTDPWFDSDALLALDIPADEVARLRELYETNQLDILYLRDQAAREGWMNRPRFREEMRDLRSSLQNELDPSQYDLLLYATGRPNRVVLQGVLSGSPAERAGLRDGDVILRYGDQTILNARELSRATTSGRAGSSVPLEVLRDGAVQRFYVPRGPLGARLRVESRPPDTGY